jgi:hypothetical protein
MPEPSASVLRSLALARQLRTPLEDRWQILQDLAMPEATPFQSQRTEGQAPPTIYDETGLVGIEEFANRLQTGIVPEGVTWARLEVEEGASDELRVGLEEVQKYAFDLISRSGLGTEINDGFKDLAGPGNICIKVSPGNWMMPVIFQAVPLADVWITPGAHGAWADIHVRYRLPPYAVEAQWRDGDMPSELKSRSPSAQVEVFESWIRDLSSPTERWLYESHIEGKWRMERREIAGEWSCPYIFGRWSKSSGKLYGVGQGMRALPAISVVNEMERLLLAHGELALSGMWQAEDDGVLNPWSVSLVPGAIIPIAPGSRGLVPLQMPGTRLDLGQISQEERRHSIRKALYNEQLGKREGTPPTAFEIEERMAELARQIGPSYGRVWKEVVAPLFLRTLKVLEMRGLIAMPRVDGRRIKVAAASSLVRSAAIGEVRRINEWLGGIANLYGPAAVQSLVPAERYMRITADRLDIPAALPFSGAEIANNAQRMGELLGAQGQPGADAALAPLLATLGGRPGGGQRAPGA